MDTTKAVVRNNGTSSKQDKAVLAIMKQIELTDNSFNRAALEGVLTGYGDSSPLYKLLATIGVRPIVNDLNSAFKSHAVASAKLENGQAGYSVSKFVNDGEEREVYTLAVKDENSIFYFSVMHDKQGEPIEEEIAVLVKAQVARDFKLTMKDGTKKTIMPAGKLIFKAVNVEYFHKIKEIAG